MTRGWVVMKLVHTVGIGGIPFPVDFPGGDEPLGVIYVYDTEEHAEADAKGEYKVYEVAFGTKEEWFAKRDERAMQDKDMCA